MPKSCRFQILTITCYSFHSNNYNGMGQVATEARQQIPLCSLLQVVLGVYMAGQ